MALLSGVKVSMGGRDYTLPPLTLGSLKRIGNKINALSNIDSVPNEEQTEAIASIVLASVNRNYPEITQDELLEMIDLGNLKEIFEAVLGVSGIKKSESSGEAVSP
jgi:secreted Zn-dependent insulinase-like peptidase